MLIDTVERTTGVTLQAAQADALGRLVVEWLLWPKNLSAVPELAARVLATGFSPQRLALLAGMSRAADPWEIREEFTLAVGELGLDWSGCERERRAALRGELCCELIRRGCLSPTVGAQFLAHGDFFDMDEAVKRIYRPLVNPVIEWEEDGHPSTEQFSRYIREYIEKTHLGEG
ncbi:MAG: hypothetical protein JWR01_1526 [Subtercola sp.]|nr:hypothetical protein [Subtercola sp.]